MIDVIQEYLVKIGFDVDNASFKDANKQLGQLEQAIGKFAQSLVGRVGTALATVGAALGTTTLSIYGFSAAMASADQQVEIFARRLLTSESNARSLRAIMQTMNIGSLEELSDISLNPELRKQFLGLRQLAGQFEPGQAAQEGLTTIREIGYSLQRLQVITNYFMLNVVGRLGQHLAGPIAEIREALDGFEQWWVDNFDEFADGLAQFMAHIVQLTVSFTKMLVVIGKIGVWALDIFAGLAKLPQWLKAAAAGVALIGAAVMAGPWAIITTAISAILLLFDDYLGWKNGKINAFGNIYGGVESFIGTIINVLTNIDQAVMGLARKFLGDEWGTRLGNAVKGAAKGAGEGALKGAITGGAVGTVLPGAGTATGAAWGAGLGAIYKGIVGAVTGWNEETGSGRSLEYLKWVAEKEGLSLTSTDGGHHNPGSLHYKGQAIDFDHKGITDEKINRLKNLYGLNVHDERVKNNPAWSGPHFHASIAPAQAELYKNKFRMMQQKQTASANSLEGAAARSLAGAGNSVTINVNGAGDPKAVGDEVMYKIAQYADLRNTRGAVL